MLASEVITDVRNELLEPIAGFWSDAELLLHINRAEQDYVARIRGLEKSATLSTVAGQVSYPLPANWLSAVVIFFNNRVDGVDSWRPLRITDFQELARERPNFLNDSTDNRGTPTRAIIWDNSLVLDPPPRETGQSIQMFYKAKPVPLTLVTDSLNIDDSLAGGIRTYVLWKAWTKEKELTLANDQRELYFMYVRDGLRWVKLRALSKVHNIDVPSHLPYTRGGGFDPLH